MIINQNIKAFFKHFFIKSGFNYPRMLHYIALLVMNMIVNYFFLQWT